MNLLTLKSKMLKGDDSNMLPKISVPPALVELPVDQARLSVRLRNVLAQLKITRLGDLQALSFEEFSLTRNCGAKTIAELKSLIELNNNIKPVLATMAIPQAIAQLPLDRLPVSVRLYNVLSKLNVGVCGELHGLSYEELRQARNCGRTTMEELTVFLEKAEQGEFDELARQYEQESADDSAPIEAPQDDSSILAANGEPSLAPALANLLLTQLPISKRLRTVLEKLGVSSLADVENITWAELRQTPNCGKKTFRELQDFLCNLRQLRLPEMEGVAPPELTVLLPQALSLPELLAFINHFVDSLPANNKEVLLRRFGGTIDETVLTLEEIGDQFNLTRERIRQIQAQTLEQLHEQLGTADDEALLKLRDACLQSVCPLTPRFLVHLTENDFALFQFPPGFYIRLLGELAPALPIVPDGRFKSIYLTGPVARIARRIKELVDEYTTPVAVAEIFQGLTAYDGLGNLPESEFFAALQFGYFNVLTTDKPDELFIETAKDKRKAIDIVTQVLAQSETVLTPEEIIQRGQEIYGPETEMPAPNSLINLSYTHEVYLLGKRALGLRQHFRLPAERWNELRDDFYWLLSEYRRPFSTIEVIAKYDFSWTAIANTYEAAQILREDARFKDLGRLHFALSAWAVEAREPVKELIVRSLEAAGQPLNTTEIGQQLQQYRSVSLTSLSTALRAHEAVRDYGCGFYGLKSWDDNFTEFFVTNRRFLMRLVRQSEQPLTFGALCAKFGISWQEELGHRLWRTLRSLPKLHFAPVYRAPETVITLHG